MCTHCYVSTVDPRRTKLAGDSQKRRGHLEVEEDKQEGDVEGVGEKDGWVKTHMNKKIPQPNQLLFYLNKQANK